MLRLLASCTLLAALFLEVPAFAASHAIINAQRGTDRNVFVSQAVEGEYGLMTKVESGARADGSPSRIWKGYGFRNTLGLELMKFTQFSVSHSYVNLRSKANSLENLHGSRLMAEAKLSFSSPIGNMEGGGGFVGSRLDYTHKLDNADFIGSGYYYTLGWNYFFSQQVSFFGVGKMYRENLVRNSGSSDIENIKTKTSSLGVGFSLWL